MEVIRQSDFDGGNMDHITRVAGTRGRGAMLRVGAQHLELFEFEVPTPKSNKLQLTVCDHGISHFCIEVANIQLEYERLKAAGVEFHSVPQSFLASKATYARDPDGNVFEILEILVGG